MQVNEIPESSLSACVNSLPSFSQNLRLSIIIPVIDMGPSNPHVRPKPNKQKSLLDDDGDGGEGGELSIRVNQSYAKRFEVGTNK